MNKTWYLDPDIGNDCSGDGTYQNPFQTVYGAVNKILENNSNSKGLLRYNSYLVSMIPPDNSSLSNALRDAINIIDNIKGTNVQRIY